MEDRHIIDLFWQRSEDAIREAAEKYGAYLTRTAQNILTDPEDCRECVSDTYWKAWNAIPPHRPRDLRAFLAKITRELSIDVYRRRTSEKRRGSEYALSLSELEDQFPGGTEPERVLEGKQLEQAMHSFLEGLPPEERRVFLGRYFFFDPLKDIAAYCGIREGKVKTMLFRTRRKLKAYLEQEGFLE